MVRVVTRLNIGGPAIHTVLLTRGLGEAGYQSVLLAGSCEGDDGDMTYLLRPSDPFVQIPELSRSVSPLRNLAALFRLCGVIRRERPDIVHTHTAMAGTVGRLAALLCRVPIVVHTFHGNSLSGYFSPAVSQAFLAIERFLGRFTDAICVVSSQQREELSGVWRVAPATKFKVVPLGLELSDFLRLKVAAPSATLEVGWFGRLVPIKDIPLLARVVEETIAHSSGVRFHIAGDGPDAPVVSDLARRFPEQVIYYGWQKDLAPVMSRCQVLLQTSRNEGTPVALIQGMAAGRPFLSTPAGGVVDMVTDLKPALTEGARWYANGVLVDADPLAFVKALLHLQAQPDLIGKMGTIARGLAASRYSAERLIGDIDALYSELLQRPKCAATAVAHNHST